MEPRLPLRGLVGVLLLGACSRPTPPGSAPADQAAVSAGAKASTSTDAHATTPAGTPSPPATAGSVSVPAAPAVPAIANKIWKVVKSSAGDAGTYYVFLADGTMLVTSPHGTPSIGSWHYSGEVLTLVEEGLPHPATLVQATPDTLAIRIAGPGQPVSITFVPVTAP